MTSFLEEYTRVIDHWETTMKAIQPLSEALKSASHRLSGYNLKC